MKSLYFLFAFVFTASLSFGQVIIHHDDDPQTTQNGLVFNEVVDTYPYDVKMHCLNTSGVSVSYRFARKIISQSTTFTDQFCDNNLCYPMSGAVDTTDSQQIVAAGDSTIMKPRLSFAGGGTATIRYYVLDVNNALAIIDSVDVSVTSVMSVEDELISISAYPNPTSEVFNLVLEGTPGLDYSVRIYNLLGEEVSMMKLSNGVNQLNVSNLKNGIYFYAILNKTDIIETKKMIVRH